MSLIFEEQAQFFIAGVCMTVAAMLLYKFINIKQIKHDGYGYSYDEMFALLNEQRKFLEEFHPKRVILIRHGESEANVDREVYCSKPNGKVSLTENGIQQADEAGKRLQQLIGKESAKFYYSPFHRTRQTFTEIAKYFQANSSSFNSNYSYVEDTRLRELEMWNFRPSPDTVEKLFKEQAQIGRFHYRFPEGESGADVFDRASQFIEAMRKRWDDVGRPRYENYVIVAHANFMRAFVMRFLKWSYEKHDSLKGPGNCEMWVFQKNPQDKAEYQIQSDLRFQNQI